MKYLFILDVTSGIEYVLKTILLLNIASLFSTLIAYKISRKIKDKIVTRCLVLIFASLTPSFISHTLFSIPAEIVPVTIFLATIGSVVFITYLILRFVVRTLRLNK